MMLLAVFITIFIPYYLLHLGVWLWKFSLDEFYTKKEALMCLIPIYPLIKAFYEKWKEYDK